MVDNQFSHLCFKPDLLTSPFKDGFAVTVTHGDDGARLECYPHVLKVKLKFVSEKERGDLNWFHGGFVMLYGLSKSFLSFSNVACCGAHEKPSHLTTSFMPSLSMIHVCKKKISSQTLRLHLTCRPNTLLGVHTLALDTATCTCLSL